MNGKILPKARQLSLVKRIEKKSNAPIKEWINKDISAKRAYSQEAFLVILEPEFEIESDEYAALEVKINSLGYEIIEKHSNKFADSIVVHVGASGKSAYDLKSLEGVAIVTNRPKPRSLASERFEFRGLKDSFLTDINGACSFLEASRQVSQLDTTNMDPEQRVNKGAGAIIVVWDFVPEKETVYKENEDFTKRKGSLSLVSDETVARDDHGGMASSICCGAASGLASDSNLVVVGLSREITSDLQVIDNLCTENPQKAVIVNMSFSSEFGPVKSEAEIDEVKASIAQLDLFMQNLKDKHPKLVFVVAAGNENLNVCEATGPVSYPFGNETRSDVLMWPQSRFNTNKDLFGSPYLFVGATEVKKDTEEGKREVSSYSNFGNCVHIYAVGGPICGVSASRGTFEAGQGTSFASPIVTSVLAVIAVSDPNGDAKKWVQKLIDTADSERGKNDEDIKFAQVGPDILTKVVSEVSEIDAPGNTIIDSNEKRGGDKPKSNFFFYVITAIVVLLIISYIAYFQML